MTVILLKVKPFIIPEFHSGQSRNEASQSAFGVALMSKDFSVCVLSVPEHLRILGGALAFPAPDPPKIYSHKHIAHYQGCPGVPGVGG